MILQLKEKLGKVAVLTEELTEQPHHLTYPKRIVQKIILLCNFSIFSPKEEVEVFVVEREYRDSVQSEPLKLSDTACFETWSLP